MRAAVLTEINKPLQILDLEQEPPKANEVRVQVKAVGVCMSDWHIMNRDWPLPLLMVLEHTFIVCVAPKFGGKATALQALDAVAPGGHAVLVGIPAFAVRAPINLFNMVFAEKTISGTYYGSGGNWFAGTLLCDGTAGTCPSAPMR